MSYRYELSKVKALVQRAARTARGENLKSPVLFYHVPKCAGTSVKSAIFESLGVREYLRGEYFVLNSHASRKATEMLGVEMRVLREQVLAYEVNQSPRPFFVTGHFVYSRRLHEHLLNQYTVVTVIRDPVKRFISHFFYNKNKATQDHFGIDMNIDEYLNSKRAKGTGRLMTYYFAGNEALADSSLSTEGLVNKAINNLRCFDLVGVLENLQHFEREFAEATGTTIKVAHHRKNPTDRSKRRSALTEGRMERIKQLCAPDIKLYEAVLSGQ